MSERDIVVKALKMEAKLKPDERIYAGRISLTYAELGRLLDTDNLDGEYRRLVESIIEASLKLFKESRVFREYVLKLAGGM